MASSILRAKKVPGIGIRKTEEQEDASEKRAYDCADKGKNPINFGLPINPVKLLIQHFGFLYYLRQAPPLLYLLVLISTLFWFSSTFHFSI